MKRPFEVELGRQLARIDLIMGTICIVGLLVILAVLLIPPSVLLRCIG